MLPLLTLALLALAAGLIATWHGVSYGYDGGHYLLYARAIDQTGLLRLNRTFWHNSATAAWLDAWPPLYPMILSLGGVVGIDPIPWARVVTVASLV
ncbi:MAG TPA: hypothetical protein VER79_10385, partial [Candidatus Limnocylindrales bacterium]|nr:hypothetical protein [Candidatus Limnocylindrales bacterium]